MSILIIDPDITTDISVRQVFEEQGLDNLDIIKSAAQVGDYLQARERASGTDELTLIVINSELDQGDGFELCREIRKSSLGKHAYIMILVSSANNTVAIDKARYCGADDFSVKPYHSLEFAKHLMLYAHQKTVLLVEDDPTVCQLVSSILYKKRVEVIVSDDGLHAYNLINSVALPRLVILDIGLPNMSGLKLINHIRSKSLWKKTPVIMLTASTSASDVKQSLDAGANEYIVKPFKIDAFTDRISRYFPEAVS
jgi:DNA-binding response OmpR family regulator